MHWNAVNTLCYTVVCCIKSYLKILCTCCCLINTLPYHTSCANTNTLLVSIKILHIYLNTIYIKDCPNSNVPTCGCFKDGTALHL